MTLPLSDVRVVEMCQVYAGPFAAMLLADQGAEVIKLEAPVGDSSRRGPTSFPDIDGLSLPFLSFNRNKRSILVNIHTPKGKELAYRLFRWADVLLIATRVATRQRWGFTYEDIAAINPRLVYASITGFGEEGPDADLPGIDLVIQARAGDIAGRRQPDSPPPPAANFYHFDMATGMLAAYAVTLALRQREQTGQGQKIELNLLQSALASQSVNMTRVGESNDGGAASILRLPTVYRCSDDKYIFVLGAGARWEPFCASLGLDDLLTDPRFDTIEKRAEEVDEIYEILTRHFSTRPAAEWEALLKAGEQMVSVVHEIPEVYNDPQVVANQMMTKFEQPGLGTVDAVTIPFKMSGTAGEPWLRRPVPTPGEHTFELLQEHGYSSEEIETLIAEEIAS